MTRVVDADREAYIEWQTYTPDGRVLTVRRTADGWTARCNGGEYGSASLLDAIRDAVGHARGEALRLDVHSFASIERWVVDQASRIEREAGR